MAECANSGNDAVPLNEETQIALSNDEQLANPIDNLQLVQPAVANGASIVIPSVNLNEGNFDRPNFGPQTNTQNIEANKIEHQTVIHKHYYNTEAQSSSDDAGSNNDSGSKKQVAKASKPLLSRIRRSLSWKRRTKSSSCESEDIPEGYVKICEDVYMYTEEPIVEGTSVYKGFMLHITGQKQWVAIKKIMPCTKKSVREVAHLVSLSQDSPHPNVVRILRSRVYQSLTHEELYIIMELCKEQNLQDYFDENQEKKKPLDLTKAESFAKQLVSAMEHIHNNGIIHGDLKPENILLTLDGKGIKVSDFSISKQLRDSRSATKLTGLGTDGYRAPETYSTDLISKSADVYSLGIILFSLFSNGKHPYGNDPHLRVHKMTKNVDLDLSGLPEEMGPLRGNLVGLLIQILQPDPQKRPTITKVEQVLLHGDSPPRYPLVKYPHLSLRETNVASRRCASYESPLRLLLRLSGSRPGHTEDLNNNGTEKSLSENGQSIL